MDTECQGGKSEQGQGLYSNPCRPQVPSGACQIFILFNLFLRSSCQVSVPLFMEAFETLLVAVCLATLLARELVASLCSHRASRVIKHSKACQTDLLTFEVEPAKIAQAPPEEVLVSASGKCYHVAHCRHLKNTLGRQTTKYKRCLHCLGGF